MNPYIYMFVRGDLSHPQQIVQVAHATFEIGKLHPIEGPYAVLISVKDEEELLRTREYLDVNGIQSHIFFEPDVDSFTAIVTQPLTGDRRKLLRKFSLLK